MTGDTCGSGPPHHLGIARIDRQRHARRRLASASITGHAPGGNSSSMPIGSAPGRVNSPPMSRMSAPSASSRRACAMAAVRVQKLPAVGEAVRRDVDDAHDAGPSRAQAGDRRGAAHRAARPARASSRRAGLWASSPADSTCRRTVLPSRSITSAAANAAVRIAADSDAQAPLPGRRVPGVQMRPMSRPDDVPRRSSAPRSGLGCADARRAALGLDVRLPSAAIVPVSPEKRTTMISSSTMHCTSSVLLLLDQAMPWHHLPIGSSPDLVSWVPLRVHTCRSAVGIEEWRAGRLVGAVHHGNGDELAVGRDLDALRRLPHRVGVDHARRIGLEVDDADGVGIAAADADIGRPPPPRPWPRCRERRGAGPRRSRGLVASTLLPSMVSTAMRCRRPASRARSCRPGVNTTLARPGVFGLPTVTLPRGAHGRAGNGEHRHRALGTVGHQRQRAGLVDGDARGALAGLQRGDDLGRCVALGRRADGRAEGGWRGSASGATDR